MCPPLASARWAWRHRPTGSHHGHAPALCMKRHSFPISLRCVLSLEHFGSLLPPLPGRYPMYPSHLPRVTAATSGLMAAVALCATATIGHQLGAQQVQSATTPTAQTERHGYGYGVASVVVPTPNPTPQAPLPQASAPAPQVVEQIDEPSVHLDQLMTLREWDATGVARLRPEERVALEAWVEKYRNGLLDNTSRPNDAQPSTPTAAVNGDVAPPAEAQPTAPTAPSAAYGPPPTYAPPVGPSYVTPAPQIQPAYAPPSYAAPAPMSGSASQPMAYAAPPASYAYPTQGAPYQAPPVSYQPNYQPVPVAAPQSAVAPVAPQSYAPPQAYATYPQPAAPQAAVNPIPAPAVQYPTAPSAPAQAFQPQPLAPMTPTPYAVTAVPAAPPAPAGAVVKTGLAVKNVQGGSRFVSLTDGSMWDVYTPDRGEVGVWRAQDPVYVRLATTNISGGYDREIVNASRNVLVRVKFAGQLESK